MNLSRFLEMNRQGATPEVALRDSQVHWKGGGDKQTSTTTSKPYQQGQYDKLLGAADQWLNQGGFDKQYGGQAGYDPVADLTAGQQAGIAGLGSTGADLQSLLSGAGLGSLSAYLGEYDPSKTGLSDAIRAANEQSTFDFETSAMPQIRQGATDAGQFGSSRAGIAEGLARSRLSQQQQNNAATLAFNDQQQFNQNRLNALGNLTSIAKGLGSGSAMQYDAGTLEQNQAQKEIQGDLQKWAYENNVDLNDLLAYQQLISGDMGGTNTTVSKTSGGGGGFGSALGSIAGAIGGGMVGGPQGAMVGANVGGQTGGLLF